MYYQRVVAHDRAAVRIPPPLVYAGAALLGCVLHARVPLDIEIFPAARIGLASAVAVAGVLLVIGALGLFRRTGQKVSPWKITPEVISTGVYRFTRNPMYVGLALLQAALGIGLSNGWIVALVPAALVVIYTTAIRPEEAYLERKFGQPYLDYMSSVRRWL